MSEKPLDKCEVCGEPAEKLVSSSSFHLKGSGWYVTDYKNQAKTAPTAAEPASSVSTPKETTVKKVE